MLEGNRKGKQRLLTEAACEIGDSDTNDLTRLGMDANDHTRLHLLAQSFLGFSKREIHYIRLGVVLEICYLGLLRIHNVLSPVGFKFLNR